MQRNNDGIRDDNQEQHTNWNTKPYSIQKPRAMATNEFTKQKKAKAQLIDIMKVPNKQNQLKHHTCSNSKSNHRHNKLVPQQ